MTTIKGVPVKYLAIKSEVHRVDFEFNLGSIFIKDSNIICSQNHKRQRADAPRTSPVINARQNFNKISVS